MIPLILAASLLAPSEAPSAFIKAAEAIEAKDGKVFRAAFEEAVSDPVNIRPEMRERLAPIVAAIRYQEDGRAGREYGCLSKYAKDKTYRKQAGECAFTVQKNYDRWVKAGRPDDFITFLGGRYCPLDDPRDKGGLNKYWIPNVTKFYKRFAGKNARIR